jgi:uracil-DNA glycosylase family 4
MNQMTRTRLFLLDERELFGEALLAEEPHTVPVSSSSAPPVMPTRKTPLKGDEPTFFGPAPEPWQEAQTLDELYRMTRDCRKCELWATRKNYVFGVGNPHATFMVIGEAPGADEDEQGEPFVGRAGQLLNKILEAIGFKREDVYIANILKSRPPNNATPTLQQSEACKPYLKKQIALLQPKVILCVGRTAAQNLLGTNEAMGQLRGGRVFDYEGIALMVTYHPAALLRNPHWKRPTWEDVQAARTLHDQLIERERGTKA